MKIIGIKKDQTYDSYRNVVEACEDANVDIPDEVKEYFLDHCGIPYEKCDTDHIPELREEEITEIFGMKGQVETLDVTELAKKYMKIKILC